MLEHSSDCEFDCFFPGEDEKMKKVGSGIGCAIALVSAAVIGGQLHATPVNITVPNNSFESPPVPPGQPVSLSTDSWTLNGSGTIVPITGVGNVPAGAGVFPNPASPGGPPPANDAPYSNGHLDNADGSQAAFLFSNVGNSISQALTDPGNGNQPTNFAANKAYTLTISVADAQSLPPPTDRLQFELYYTDGTGSHVVGQSTLSKLTSSPSISQQRFNDYSFTTPILAAGDPAVGKQINIIIDPLDNGGGQFDIDNVRLTSDVPEPAMLGLIGLGAVALGSRRRQR
jgi:hypothetical protein